MGERSSLGAEVWNLVVDEQLVKPDAIVIDPSTWVSQSSANDFLRLGVRPMSQQEKERIFFHAERFTYEDEVAYRLLHETCHSLLFSTQDRPATRQLMRLAANIRRASRGQEGLTALGSLDYYGTVDHKIIEDTAELVTMQAWSPDYGSLPDF